MYSILIPIFEIDALIKQKTQTLWELNVYRDNLHFLCQDSRELRNARSACTVSCVLGAAWISYLDKILPKKYNHGKTSKPYYTILLGIVVFNAWPRMNLCSKPVSDEAVMFWHLTGLICQANQVFCSVINSALWRWNKCTWLCQINDRFAVIAILFLNIFLWLISL